MPEWASHPQPKDDEVIESWLFRLASSNHISVKDLLLFVHTQAGTTSSLSYDLTQKDCFYLSEATTVPYENLRLRWKMSTVHRYRYINTDSYNVEMRQLKFKGMTSFCSGCLHSDLHGRQHWLEPRELFCDLHDNVLDRMCPICDTPVTILSSTRSSGNLFVCYKCKTELSTVTHEPLPYHPDVKKLWRLVKDDFSIENAPRKYWDRHLILYGRRFEYWLVDFIWRELFCPDKEHLLDIVQDALPLPLEKDHVHRVFSRYEPRRIFIRLACLHWALEDWPWRLHQLLRLRSSRVVPRERAIHKWINAITFIFRSGGDPHFLFLPEHLLYFAESGPKPQAHYLYFDPTIYCEGLDKLPIYTCY